MKTDFGQIIQSSFDFALKYKVLWIFAFIMLWLSTFLSFFQMPGSARHGSGFLDGIAAPSDSAFVAIGIGLLVLLFGYMVVSIYLTCISSIALMRSVKHDADANIEAITFKALWNESHQYIWRIIGLNLLWVLMIIIIGIIIIIPVALIAVTPVAPLAVLAFCCAAIVAIPVVLVAGAMIQTSQVLIVNYNYGVFDSIAESWVMLKSNLGPYILAGLIMLGFGILIGIIGAIVSFLFQAGSLIFASIASDSVISIIVALLYALVVGAIYSALLAPFSVFSFAYWTKFVTGIKDQV
jgi:hypothetical protein